MAYRGVYVLFHDRPVNAASVAHGKLYKALVDIAAFQVVERVHAVFRAVCRNALVARVGDIHAFYDAARYGEAACASLEALAELMLDLDTGRQAHLVKFLECEHRVHARSLILLLFRNAGADENDLRLRHSPLYIHCVSYHGRHYRRKILPQLGKMLFHEQVKRRAGRGDDDILLCLPEHTLVLALYDRCAYCRLLGIGKAELHERLAHRV